MRKFEIKLPNGIIISSKLLETEVAIIDDVRKNDMGNGYVLYCMPPVELNNEKIVFNLCFYNGALNSLNMSIYNPDLYGHGWNDFSEEKERACAKETENWLAINGYKTGKYSWGEIWAGYDAKSGSGHAGVRYAL